MTIRLYQSFRQNSGEIKYKSKAEQASIAYLESVYNFDKV